MTLDAPVFLPRDAQAVPRPPSIPPTTQIKKAPERRAKMTTGNALFSLETPAESGLEAEVSAFIASLEEVAPLTPSQRVVASMCRSLAQSITAGNRKGRSVANDVERLHATMQELAGTDDDAATDADLTPAERQLLDALQSVPARNGDATEGYAA